MSATTTKKIVSDLGSKPASSGLGLDSIGDLSGLLDAPMQETGPLVLQLDSIDEDPNQPRSSFDSATLIELADSIKARGVKTPISVRPNMEVPGRYLINHGARRYRASKLAGNTTIPGFIDGDYTEADQVIENLQRDNLTAREVADFIGREIARGKKKKDIAHSISKSPAFVTQHAALLDLPDPIAQAFNEDRCRDVTVINELVTAFKQKPAQVAEWLEDESQEITRGSVKLLREFLNDRPVATGGEGNGSDESEDQRGEGESTTPAKPDAAAAGDTAASLATIKKTIVLVEHKLRPARLLLNRRPSNDGLGWIRYEDDGSDAEIELGTITVNRLLEG